MDDQSHAHNSLARHQLQKNHGQALDTVTEHHHGHLHHTAHAEQGRGETEYSKGTTYEESNIPDQDPHGQPIHRKHPPNNPTISTTVAGAEKGGFSRDNSSEEDPRTHTSSNFYMKYRLFFHLFIWLLFTGLWLALTLRLCFFYVPVTIITNPIHLVWNNVAVKFVGIIPERMRLPAGAAVVVGVLLIGAFVTPESRDNTRANRAVSLFGLAVIFISELARDLLGFADQGTSFLTSPDVPKLGEKGPEIRDTYKTADNDIGWFLVGVLPAVIFFVALVQLLYYWGTLQWLIQKFAVFFFWSMRVSGAEAVVAAASPFIGQGESAMLIKPFVAHLTQAELHQVMCSGFATIAGSVLVAYIGLGVNGQALISSCVMSIPASLAISKLRYPETEETLTTGRCVIPDDDEHRAANSLHAFANGAWLGLKIAGMILATLLCILALLGLANGLLTWWGRYLNINDPPLTVELIVGYICYPIAFLLGVPRNGDLLKVAQLIGTKLIANEFVAYTNLQTDPAYADLSPRSRLIATYALCGFANLGSLGTQIGVLSQIAPGRGGDVSRLAISALVAGALSTLTSASIAGLKVAWKELVNTIKAFTYVVLSRCQLASSQERDQADFKSP
ncbi:MAG: hypothetical protein Q9188_000245 [Gyalolechia gomerana]